MTTITTKIEKANVNKKNYQKHQKVNITTKINTTKQQPNNNPATGSSTNNNNTAPREAAARPTQPQRAGRGGRRRRVGDAELERRALLDCTATWGERARRLA